MVKIFKILLNFYGCYESPFKWYQSLNHKIYILKVMASTNVVIIFNIGCKCCYLTGEKWQKKWFWFSPWLLRRCLYATEVPLCKMRVTKVLLCEMRVTKVPPDHFEVPPQCWEGTQCLFLPPNNIFNLCFDLQIDITCNGYIYLLDIHLRIDHGLRFHPMVCNN